MDIFGFIRRTWELGLDGVEINIIPDYNLHPQFGTLISDDDVYLARVRRTIEEYGLFCEIDTRLTKPAILSKSLRIAHKLGANVVRTYTHVGDFQPALLQQAVLDIRELVPLLKKYRIRLAVENHEHEISSEVLEVIRQVNSPWVGAHCDVGNGMMAWEDPVQAVTNLAPVTYCTHFKDHIICMHDDMPVVCGVPLGQGSIDIDTCFRLLVEHAPITNINIETCFPYCAKFQRPKGTGGVTEFTGAFEIKDAPFSTELIKPLDYYYPYKASEKAVRTLLEAQEDGVKTSAAVMKGLRDKYCGVAS